MDGYDVEIHGDEAAARAVARIMLGFSDLRPFWPMLVPLFIGWMGQQFATEGGWGGQQWAPLTPAYAAVKGSLHPGRSILIASGELRQAASRPEREAAPRTLTLRIVDSKVGYHQEGTTRMPARPVIPADLPSVGVREVEAAAEVYAGQVIATAI